MKSLNKYITESSVGVPIISHFNDAQISLLYKHIKDATMKFDVKWLEFKNAEFYVKDRYPYVSFEYYDSSRGRNAKWEKYNSQVTIGANYISMGYLDLHVDTRGYRSGDNCSLISMKYAGGKTSLVFDIYQSVHNIGLMKGTVTIEIPCDLTNVSYDYSKFDCKGYCAFMKKYLPMKADYLRQIDLDDLVDWNCNIQNNKLFIYLELPTGKGYSSHSRRTDYVCTLKGASYSCNRELYDRDHEAQMVRKFLSGIKVFLKNDFTKIPEQVTITVSQELD